jgi:tetratricopeptide (TPR) repeat protein
VNRKERRAARKQSKGPLPRHAGISPGALSKNSFIDAVQNYRAGRHDEAERLCRDALMLDPNRFDALHLLGVLAADAGNYEGAAEILGQSLAINERNHDCHFQLGNILRLQGRNFDAASHLARAIELRPDLVEAHVALGDTFVAHGDAEQARACYERALAVEPDRIDALYGLGNAALLEGRLGDAVDLYRRVISRNPFAEAHCKLGIALAEQGQLPEATQQIRQAIALNPNFGDAYRFLARTLLLQGDAASALAAARQSLALGVTPEAKAAFVQCAIALPAIPADGELHALVSRALTEGWGSAEDRSVLAGRIRG